MGLYSVIFSDPSRAERIGMLLAVIGEPTDSLMALRLRDAWVEKAFGPTGDQPVIAIYTRNGGGNREHYNHDIDGAHCTACAGDEATEHPSYLSDADDEFDSTYRTYRFKVGNPKVDDDIIETLLEVAEENPVDMSERWRQAIDAMSGVPE